MRNHCGDDNASPRLTVEEQKHIDKIASKVATDELTERLLLRLLRITKNYERWGFLLPEHPHHPYFLKKKVSEQCRSRRPPVGS